MSKLFLQSSEIGDTTFQVFMKTTNNKIEPFTATYQTIDEERQIKAFTLQNVTAQLQRQEKLYQRNMIQKRLQHKRTNVNGFRVNCMMGSFKN